jgi:hypothetical protein
MTEPGKAKVPRGPSGPLLAQYLVCGFDDVVIRMVAAINDEMRRVAGHTGFTVRSMPAARIVT